MLSYLKEGQPQIPAPGDNASPSGAPAVSSPNDYLTVSGHSQKLRQSTILLLALFGVGVLGVWFMIKKTTPVQAAAANDDQANLDAAIAQLSGMQSEVNNQMNSVVGRFYQQSSIGQIGVDELKKNPFKREMGSGLIDEEKDRQKRQALLSAATAKLQLWSITATPRGVCCMIDDKVLYVGDTINGMTVKGISDNTVQLEQDGVVTELKIE